jgi:hypothetical protein
MCPLTSRVGSAITITLPGTVGSDYNYLANLVPARCFPCYIEYSARGEVHIGELSLR